MRALDMAVTGAIPTAGHEVLSRLVHDVSGVLTVVRTADVHQPVSAAEQNMLITNKELVVKFGWTYVVKAGQVWVYTAPVVLGNALAVPALLEFLSSGSHVPPAFSRILISAACRGAVVCDVLL